MKFIAIGAAATALFLSTVVQAQTQTQTDPGIQVTYGPTAVAISGVVGLGLSETTNSGNRNKYQESNTHAVPFVALSAKQTIDADLAAVLRVSRYVFLNGGTTAPFESYIGLSSASRGTVTAGSMYDLLADLVPYTSERYTSLLATHPGNLDRTVGNALSNTVKYKSPVFSGVGFGLEFGIAQPGSTTNVGRVVGGEVNWSSGPFSAVAVGESVNGVPYAPAQKLGVKRLYGIDFSHNSAAAVLQDQDTATIGVAYDKNGVRIMGNYSYTALHAAGARETAQSVDLGAYDYVTARTRIGGGYSYTKLGTYQWNQAHVNVDYALSKWVSLYALTVFQKAGSGQLAVMRNQPVATRSDQAVFEVGTTLVF